MDVDRVCGNHAWSSLLQRRAATCREKQEFVLGPLCTKNAQIWGNSLQRDGKAMVWAWLKVSFEINPVLLSNLENFRGTFPAE